MRPFQMRRSGAAGHAAVTVPCDVQSWFDVDPPQSDNRKHLRLSKIKVFIMQNESNVIINITNQ